MVVHVKSETLGNYGWAYTLVQPPVCDTLARGKESRLSLRTTDREGNPHAKFTIGRLWRVSGRK